LGKGEKKGLRAVPQGVSPHSKIQEVNSMARRVGNCGGRLSERRKGKNRRRENLRRGITPGFDQEEKGLNHQKRGGGDGREKDQGKEM